jgi:tryptophan-rich sensory protein
MLPLAHLAGYVAFQHSHTQARKLQVRNNPPWFKALVWMELLVQMPCSIALLYGYAQRKKWLRALGSLYAVHVLTTMPPLYMHFESVMKVPHKYCVEAIYAPWVVLPLLMLLRYACGAPPGTSRKRPSQSGSEGVARKKSM